MVGECEDTCIAEYGKARNKLVLYASDDVFEKYAYLIVKETVSKEESSYLESQVIKVEVLTRLTSITTGMITEYEFKVQISRMVTV